MPLNTSKPATLARSAVLLAALALAGCTLGPEPTRPVTAADGVRAFAHAPEAEPAEHNPSSAWWKTIGDEATVELVELALEHNTDLQAAAARVLEAEAGLRQSRGARMPQVSVGAGANRQKSSFVLPGSGRVATYSTTYSDSLDVSYVVDLFGKLKRSQQSAWASLLAQEQAREALEHAVVAQVVHARVLVATLERSLALAGEIRTSWERTLATVERRYGAGLVQPVDLYLARENLSATRANEAAIEGQLAQARHALDVLVGRRPGSAEALPSTLAELPELEPVPLGIPAALLDRRPDLRQKEMELAAATYGVGAALADLFPSLTLTGSAGTVSDSVSDLTSSDGLIYSAVANLVGPLFTGGQRRAGVQTARARADQATAAYAGAVLGALQEVEDALVAESSARNRLEHSRRRVEEARAADRLARDRYQRGVERLLQVLETERRLRSAEDALIAVHADLWNARIGLHLALGGDWQHDPEDEPEADLQASCRCREDFVMTDYRTASLGVNDPKSEVIR